MDLIFRSHNFDLCVSRLLISNYWQKGPGINSNQIVKLHLFNLPETVMVRIFEVEEPAAFATVQP